MSKSRTLASLGLSCQTAHQLGRIAEEENQLEFSKGPFDWLICPPTNLIKWLDAGLPIFEKDELHLHRGKVYWSRFDFWFWHGFHVRSGEVKSIDINAAFDRERKKLAYQKQVFSNLSPNNTTFFISNIQNNLSSDVFLPHETDRFHFHIQSMENVQQSISKYFSTPVKLVCVSQNSRWTGGAQSKNPNLTIKLQQPETSEWKGKDDDWDETMNSL